MRTKSLSVRSWHRASRKSLDPYPPTASLTGEANERFGSGVSTTRCDPQCDSGNADVEIVPDAFDKRDGPHKKRPCLGTSDTDRGSLEPLNLDACIVCDLSDDRVLRCSGIDCILSFHGDCLNLEFGESDDLANAYCPYCWFKILALKHKSVTEKAVVAGKAVSKYQDREMKSRDEVEERVPPSQEDTTLYCDENGNQERSVDSTDVVGDHELRGEKDACSSEKEQVQVVKDSDKSREEDMLLIEYHTDYQPEEHTEKLEGNTDKSEKVIDEVEALEDEDRRVDTENFQDAEEDEDYETAKYQTKVNTDAGEKGDVSPFVSMQESLSGKEHDQVQQNEKQGRRRRRRRLILNDIDSEFSSNESTNDSLSGKMKNQQRKHSATNKVAQSNTVRDISFFKSNQRRRLFWTSEEEEMLKVGVEKFAAQAKKNMPWRKILEMGEKVFNETRTPADLKDKWRNMIGGGRSGKKTN